MRFIQKRLIGIAVSGFGFVAGAAMLAIAFQIDPIEVSAQTPPTDCMWEAEFLCDTMEACCNGVCYDPVYYSCCNGVLTPIAETEE